MYVYIHANILSISIIYIYIIYRYIFISYICIIVNICDIYRHIQSCLVSQSPKVMMLFTDPKTLTYQAYRKTMCVYMCVLLTKKKKSGRHLGGSVS